MSERTPHILVVDDERRSVELLVRALRAIGDVEMASSGDEGWEVFRSGEFDLVISDQRMPGELSGADLLSRVAERSEHTARVLLTAYADLEATVQAVNEGRIHAYVEKPWKPDELAQTARVLIERCRLARRSQMLALELTARTEQLEVALAELRRAQTELIRAENLTAIGRTVAMVVHDIRNPLSVIRSATSLLRWPEADLQDWEREDLLEKVDEEAKRLVTICGELLQLSRPSAAEEERTPVPFDDLLRSALRAVSEQAGKAGVQILERLDSGTSLRVDAERMRRVFVNLAANAIEAMADGGTLRVESDRMASHAVGRVIDTGPGIPEEIRERLFDPFFTHGRKGGTGLGLAIARTIVEEHGGELKLEKSAPGRTVFEVWLPME